MAVIAVGLGGNAGTEAEILARFQAAIAQLEALPYAKRASMSPAYVSAPQGLVVDQPAFLNAACIIEVEGHPDPSQVMADFLAIEARLGRDRDTETPGGVRAIDLDLLLAGDLCGRFSGPPVAIVPHPRLHERRFALLPLCDLFGADHPIPGAGETIGQRLADPAVSAQRVDRIRP